jgi:hypothetical protein
VAIMRRAPFFNQDLGHCRSREESLTAMGAGRDEVNRILDPYALQSSQMLPHGGAFTRFKR